MRPSTHQLKEHSVQHKATVQGNKYGFAEYGLSELRTTRTSPQTHYPFTLPRGDPKATTTAATVICGAHAVRRKMREKDHSPRKMLPSPKQGAVYPLLGLGSSTLPAPFDLSLVNRSSSSNLLHQQQQQHQSLAEQPLDLRVERKKSSTGGGGGGGNTSTSTSSDDETDPPRASSTDSKPGSNVIFFNDSNNNSNSNLNNNHSNSSGKQPPSDSEKSPSPTNHHHHHNNNNNSAKYTNNNHINIKDEFRISNLANHTGPGALFSGPPGLNPLMLEAIAKAGLPLPYRGSFLPPRSSASYDLQRLKEREALAVSLSQLRQNASNTRRNSRGIPEDSYFEEIRSFMGKVTQLPIPLRLQQQQQQQQQSPSSQPNAGRDGSPYGRRSGQPAQQQHDGQTDTHSSRSSTPSDEEPVSPAGSIGSPPEQDIKMETNNNEDGDEPLQVT
uniref:Uncharacterized protein n=1 Tax=Anopheles epiroticus TaxID=199890 RepID=A0A182PF98_9DIPT